MAGVHEGPGQHKYDHLVHIFYIISWALDVGSLFHDSESSCTTASITPCL